MSSCLSGGGGRTYGFDLEIVKSQSNNTATRSTSTASHSSSSSQSSTVSESINSPLSISTRKPRTPRKRPHQTYNEAAALLSTVYPNIFSTKTLSKSSLNPSKTPNNNNNNNNTELSEFLPPSPVFDNTEFLIKQQEQVPRSNFFSKTAPIEVSGDFKTAPIDSNSGHGFDEADDFDAESILDEEMEEGIDSIMGNLSVNNNSSSNDDGMRPSRNSANTHNSPTTPSIGASLSGERTIVITGGDSQPSMSSKSRPNSTTMAAAATTTTIMRNLRRRRRRRRNWTRSIGGSKNRGCSLMGTRIWGI
ncbi:hypothetical protein Scep_023196 [Stephania cephalantha]|uniref:Uncharacterized protein n=1 Tax=Stephania cephalantha TaxID=152367 RepID=A0AAP0HX32_9MAGN